jgi:hypothetical protein
VSNIGITSGYTLEDKLPNDLFVYTVSSTLQVLAIIMICSDKTKEFTSDKQSTNTPLTQLICDTFFQPLD